MTETNQILEAIRKLEFFLREHEIRFQMHCAKANRESEICADARKDLAELRVKTLLKQHAL